MKRFVVTMTVALLYALGLGNAPLRAATISQENFELWYDYGEFFANADGRDFPVEIRGHAFLERPDPAAQQAFERSLLSIMQAHKPPPRLTFVNAASTAKGRPDYRFALLFNPSDSGPVQRTCSDLAAAEHAAPRPGAVVIEVAYCRNQQTLSSLKARFAAAGIDDRDFGHAFDQIFAALVPRYNPIRGDGPGRRKH